MKPPVLLTRRIPSAAFARLDAACDVDLHDGPKSLTPDELKARVQGKQGLICLLTDRIDGAVVDAGLPDLKIVANVAVGYDNVDVPAVKSRGVVFTNTPDVLTEATAELTWGLILSLARRVTEGDRLIRRGEWRGWALDFMLGTELRGKQLGLIGRGRIGRAVAAKAPAFGMTAVFAQARHVARRTPRQLGCGLDSYAGDARNASSVQPANARADEAIGAPRQYRARQHHR